MRLVIRIPKQEVNGRIIQILLSLLIIYEGWYIPRNGAIPYVLQIITLAIVGLTVLICPSLVRRQLSNTVLLSWFGFGLTSLVGLVLLSAPQYGYSSLGVYMSFLVVVLCAGVVNEILPEDSEWLSNTIILVSLLCAFSALFFGYAYPNGIYTVTTMGENNNPNGLGFMMALGAYYVLDRAKHNSGICWTLHFVVAIVFMYVALNTGSRSGVISCGVVIVLSLMSQIKYMKGSVTNRFIKRVILIAVVLGSIAMIMRYFSVAVSVNSALLRLAERFSSDSFGGREHLYTAAWEMFIESPLIGIGFDCFAVKAGYGYYTHSTYMELLACTGIIGAVLFLTPVIRALISSIKNINRDNGQLLVLLMLFVVNGMFSIWFYELIDLIILYIIINKSKRIVSDSNKGILNEW